VDASRPLPGGVFLLLNAPTPGYPVAAMSDVKQSVTLMIKCECGYIARGNEDQVVDLITRHAGEMHNMKVTREQAIARAERV
jgi:predicted small metal-binding protein